MSPVKICVLGAGCIGVSTAFNILEQLPAADVTLIAEIFSPFTTSDVSAGFWRPYTLGNTPVADILKWGTDTWTHLHGLANSEAAASVGTFLTSGQEIYQTDIEDPIWKDCVLGYRRLSSKDLASYPNKYKSGFFYTTLVCDQQRYLPWLLEKFMRKGGKTIQKKINSFKEIAHKYDIIVNCTGIGARSLCNDSLLKSHKGQVIRAKAPWIKHFTIMPDDGMLVICLYDQVLFGFTNVPNDNPEINVEDKNRIMKDCLKLIPSLVKATDFSDGVGFRPVRSAIRLEIEHVHFGSKIVPIVHNYGHGGSGITLHWGCAKEAVRLVKEEMSRHKSHL